jgi:outer membrane protease
MTKDAAYSHTMRTIPSFIFFVTVCCGFFAAPFTAQNACSQTPAAGSGKDSRFGFSAYAQAGVLYGHAEEIVYWNSQDSDYKSQLLWDVKPLAYAGAGLSFSINELRDAPGLYTGLSFKAGVPARTGRMEDFDWQNPSDHSIVTNYSVHENYTTQAFLTDFALGVSLPLKHQDRILAFLKLGGAVSYRYFDWVARDGYYQYVRRNTTDPWDPSAPKTPVYGDQIAYYQHWLTVSPGVALVVPIRSRWLVEVSLDVAPGLIWVWSLDEHIGRQLEFQDRPAGGVLLEPAIEASYAFNARLSLAACVSYRFIRGSRGPNRERPAGGSYSFWHPNAAGAGFRALDAGLILKASF